MAQHIHDCERIIRTLDETQLTLFGEKSVFGRSEVIIVGHLCGPYGKKPASNKVNAINAMLEVCGSVTEVTRFLGACVFYHIWIPHFAHISDP